jgi:cytochrome c-type biogenesis protein CcmH/NrfG
MSETQNSTSPSSWNSTQAYTLSVICLLVGLAGGWFIRGSQAPSGLAIEKASAASAAASSDTSAQPTAEQIKHMADKQAEPLLAQLQADPNNAELLAKIGNIYYDTQQFPLAIDYYQRSLKSRPGDASVRTDMATAYWYAGNPDTAITEFKRALADEPNKPNALFNMGVVQWQGKMDNQAAIATWQKLLDTNPNYQGKDKVVELMAQVKKHAGIKPGAQAKPLAE